jgi:hypothetical protein
MLRCCCNDTVQITSTNENEPTVSALTKEQAKSAATDLVESGPHVKVKAVSVRERH